uniref:Putative secreted protein n=1 Tax=Anopheles darlingi TaxID=43151 RepID=A0A2M4DEB1_ANODA
MLRSQQMVYWICCSSYWGFCTTSSIEIQGYMTLAFNTGPTCKWMPRGWMLGWNRPNIDISAGECRRVVCHR